MAEQDNQASQASSAQANQATSPPPPPPPPPPPAAGASDPPARPEYLPEKFWDAKTGQPNVEAMAKAYSTLESGRGKLKETLTAEIKTAIEAERRKGVPAKPEDYKIAALPDAKDVVILDKPPDADFKPEPGKVYAVLKPDSKLLAAVRTVAHEYAIPPEKVAALATELAREIGFRPPTAEETKAARQAVYAALGDQGEQRVAHIGKQLAALIGEKHAQALDLAVESPAQVQAIEALLEKTGQAKFAPTGGAPALAPKTRDELRNLIADPRYHADPAYKKQVDEEYRRAFSK